MHTYRVYFSSFSIVRFVVFIYVFLWYSLLIILYSTNRDIFDVLDYVFYFSYWDSCLSIWDFFFKKGLSTYKEVPPFLLIFGWLTMLLFFNLVFYFIPHGYFYLFSFFLFSFWYIVLLNTYWRKHGMLILFRNFISINWFSYADDHVATHIEFFWLSLRTVSYTHLTLPTKRIV